MNNDIYLEKFKQKLEERKQPIDTTYLQLRSVRLFMEELGYELAGDPNDAKNLFAKGFVRAKKEYKYDRKGEYFPRFVSFLMPVVCTTVVITGCVMVVTNLTLVSVNLSWRILHTQKL